jgi:hypothetical protein
VTDTWIHSANAAARQPASHHAPGKGHGAGCTCPACATLATFVRPRFFAGQLLTDTELRLLEQYAIDKHRLHNLHLHGWGVVCGLQVLCDDCGNDVKVESGYAIDPCGNDVIVPATQPVPVLQLIEACRAGDRPEPCDPPQWPTADGCEHDETWCLTVRYREHHTRAVTPLGGRAKPANGGCGCGGTCSTCGGSSSSSGSGRAGWQCECGAPRSVGVCECEPAPTSPTRPADCEPSRTHELFEFGVCRSDGSCADLCDRLAGTFPVKVLECITALRPIFTERLTTRDQKTAATLLLGGDSFDDDSAHESVCALYEAVVELYVTNPLRTTCVLPAELTLLDCTPRGEEESSEHYVARLQQTLQALVMLVLAYLRDCICYHLTPPCPVDPCDDRVILACLTVRDGKVVEVCNFDCRRYAGSFVSRNYWLPIGPVLSWLAALMCCFPILQRTRGRFVGSELGQMLRMPATSGMRQALMRNDYSVVSTARARVRSVRESLRPSALVDRLDRWVGRGEDEVDLGGYLNMHEADVGAGLEDAAIPVEFVELGRGDRPSFAGIGLFPTVPRGTPVTAYTKGGRVVAFSVEAGDGGGGEGERRRPAKRAARPRKRAPR